MHLCAAQPVHDEFECRLNDDDVGYVQITGLSLVWQTEKDERMCFVTYAVIKTIVILTEYTWAWLRIFHQDYRKRRLVGITDYRNSFLGM